MFAIRVVFFGLHASPSTRQKPWPLDSDSNRAGLHAPHPSNSGHQPRHKSVGIAPPRHGPNPKAATVLTLSGHHQDTGKAVQLLFPLVLWGVNTMTYFSI